ncbi:MAG: diadenylate cyclase CdaA [Cytophagaceae bacterium]|nr:diadenylate cyclase CdaA [Cytophagaceae bacterium]MDW8456436.1 diadenylate cyclase CdaA [Cytophagaceae bacterium]
MILDIQIGFLKINWVDVADILLVALVLFQVYKLMKGTIAVRIFSGFLIIYLMYLLVKSMGMTLLTSILGQFIGVGVLAAIVLFQQEIRKFLFLLGKSTKIDNMFMRNIFSKKKIDDTQRIDVDSVVDAAKTLAGMNMGALIVFGKSSELKFYAESGDILDAVISKRLLISIFEKNSPLHDGAVIIENNRIKAARCILPVSENDQIPANYGLRHRSAIGITEVTDSIVLVVSEETGQTSLALNGELYTNLSRSELKSKIKSYLFEGKFVEKITEENSVEVE